MWGGQKQLLNDTSVTPHSPRGPRRPPQSERHAVLCTQPISLSLPLLALINDAPPHLPALNIHYALRCESLPRAAHGKRLSQGCRNLPFHPQLPGKCGGAEGAACFSP